MKWQRQVLAEVLESPEMIHRYFPEAERILPYLTKTRGVHSWQVSSDATTLPSAKTGQLSVLELNTARPGGPLCIGCRHRSHSRLVS